MNMLKTDYPPPRNICSHSYAIVDVDMLHAINLYRRICLPCRFNPDVFIVDNQIQSIIEFVDGLLHDVIALPIAFKKEVYFQSMSTLIVHRNSNISSKSQVVVDGHPASSAIVYSLLVQWRFSHETQQESS